MPKGRNRIPPGGLPSRPDHWRAARRVDVAYIKELEAELAMARAHAKELEAERNDLRVLLDASHTPERTHRALEDCDA